MDWIVEGFGERIEEEYKRVLDLVKTDEDQRRIEEILEDEYPESLELESQRSLSP